MCGIFGVLITDKSNFLRDKLKLTMHDLFILSESRGKESSGMALCSNGLIHVYKKGIPASSLIQDSGYRQLFINIENCKNGNRSHTNGETNICAIGHARLVTNGTQDKHENNQPVISNGLVGVHNGIIVNDKDLWGKYPNLHREYDVDTEVVLALLSMFCKDKTVIEATQKTYGLIKGSASIAVLFKDLKCLLLATNTGSIYISKSEDSGSLLFASERFILSTIIKRGYLKSFFSIDSIKQIQADTGFAIDLNKLKLHQFDLAGKILDTSSLDSVLNYEAEIIDDSKPNEKSLTEFNMKSVNDVIFKPNIEISSTIKIPGNIEEISKAVDSLRRCTRCLLPETMPFIDFDELGLCNYCRNYNKVENKGEAALKEVVAPFRSKNGEPDCIVPFSGGRDSSFGLHYIKNELKMNPIAYSYDWGMVTDLGRRNQARICGQLGIEHILVSADIKKKRNNIRLNIEAWFKNPDLGMIPIFMAGDKQFFYYANMLMKQTGVKLILYLFNPLEKTDFKSGFCGVKPRFAEKSVYYLSAFGKARMVSYYAQQYLRNPAYINSSLPDTFSSFLAYYVMKHKYVSLYYYKKWDEDEINSTLINKYGWETAADTNNTWRIGDGTAPFYNYLYYTMAGFTENDTFRSNQIREGIITREKALTLLKEENRFRPESFKWYCDTIGIDYKDIINKIIKLPRLF